MIGGGASTRTVLLTGLAGLLAGALSMAAGEFISVSSQHELLAASKRTRRPRPRYPSSTSVPTSSPWSTGPAACPPTRPSGARTRCCGASMSVRGRRTPALTAEAVGSAIGATSSSFAFFSVGAVVPVLPFLFGLENLAAVVVAAVLTGAALMLTGGVVAVLSGGPPLRRALRQPAIRAAAAAVTYLLGMTLDAAIG